MLGKDMLIWIQSQKCKGFLVKIMEKIQKFKLFVVKSNVLSFGDITIITQVGISFFGQVD